MNRKQRRALASEMGKDNAKKITSSIDLMMTLESCCVCKTAFDRKSREHAQTWRVDVYSQEKQVKLYCPECQKKVELVKEIIEKE
jgi:hypothetical protein